ncbi:MAG: efflux RND transporter periplasmic adaptor subunit [Myxococcales bacterium]|jgi:HlyD family secretion protein
MSATEPDPGVADVLKGHPSARGRDSKRRYLWAALLLLLVVVGFGVWAAVGRSGRHRYVTEEVRRGDLVVTVTATGNLEPTNQVEVGVEVSGTIATVEVDYNDRVERGQVLARLDPTKFKAQVVRSRAALQSAKARVLQAQATVDESRAQLRRLTRLREVSKGTDPSQVDIDAADAAWKRALAERASAKADVAEANATLESNEIDLSKTVIRSPVDGIVLVRTVEPGQTVAASLQTPVLFVLAEDLTKMELHVSVDEADVGKVRPGQKATFNVDAYPDRTFSAQITDIHFGAQEIEGVITYEAVLDVDNQDLSLRPGMTATANIVVQKVTDVLLVPNAALRFSPPAREEAQQGGGLLGRLIPHPPRGASKNGEYVGPDHRIQRVWVLKDGEPVSVEITTGPTDGIMTEVVQGGIEAGTPLIVQMTTE